MEFEDQLKEILGNEASKKDATKSKTKKPTALFQHKPAFKLEDGEQWFSEVFGLHVADFAPLPDFPVKVMDASDYPAEVAVNIPKDSFYLPQPTPLYWTVRAIVNGQSAGIHGPPSSGKTTMISYIGNKLQRPVVRCQGGESTIEDWVGGLVSKGGSTEYAEANFSLAWRTPYTIILADEVWKNPSQVNMALMPALEDQNPTLIRNAHPNPDEQCVPKAEGVSVVLVDNVSGAGNGMHRFAGAQVQDGALLNRVQKHIYLDYHTRETEVKMLDMLFPKAFSEEEAAKMVMLGGLLRKAKDQDIVEHEWGVRNLKQWSQAYLECGCIALAFKQAYPFDGETDEVRSTIRTHWDNVGFGGVAL